MFYEVFFGEKDVLPIISIFLCSYSLLCVQREVKGQMVHVHRHTGTRLYQPLPGRDINYSMLSARFGFPLPKGRFSRSVAGFGERQ